MRKKSETIHENQEFVKKYDDSKYPKPSVTVDMVIFAREKEHLKVLLIKRKAEPFKDCYALPGGFVNPDEDLRHAAARELKEETNLPCDFLEQFGTYSTPGRDPRRWVISNGFLAVIDATKYQIEAGDDAKEVRWFEVSFSKEDEEWKLCLNDGEDMILATLNDTGGEKDIKNHFVTVESDALAFDHEIIIADAIMHLRSWVGTFA